jgi:hypothetical protein
MSKSRKRRLVIPIFIFTTIFLLISVAAVQMPSLDEVIESVSNFSYNVSALDILEPHEKRVEKPQTSGKPWFGLCKVAYAATTVKEFRAQVEADPQLSLHYRDFDWENAEVILTNEDLEKNVSYKKRSMILWTQKKITIKKGEILITDGKIVVRTYCCNQIADWPRGAVEAFEPPERFLSPPVMKPESDPVLKRYPRMNISPFISGGNPPYRPSTPPYIVPSGVPPMICDDIPDDERPLECNTPREPTCEELGTCDIPHPPTCEELGTCDTPLPPGDCDPTSSDCIPLSPVPEPTTWILFGTGVIGLGLVKRYFLF